MRGLGDPDAFPRQRSRIAFGGGAIGSADRLSRTDHAKPAMASLAFLRDAAHLWTTLEHSVNHWPVKETA